MAMGSPFAIFPLRFSKFARFASAESDRLSRSDRTDTQRIPTGGTPAHAAVSIRAGYNPTENLQLTAALENLLDDDYRLHGSGLNEPGFNAIFGVKLLW